MLVVEVVIQTLELGRVRPPLYGLNRLWSHPILYIDTDHLLPGV